jgi:hypothetical protein
MLPSIIAHSCLLPHFFQLDIGGELVTFRSQYFRACSAANRIESLVVVGGGLLDRSERSLSPNSCQYQLFMQFSTASGDALLMLADGFEPSADFQIWFHSFSSHPPPDEQRRQASIKRV